MLPRAIKGIVKLTLLYEIPPLLKTVHFVDLYSAGSVGKGALGMQLGVV